MPAQVKRATIYFDPELHRALKLKAVETSRSITDLVNQAVRMTLSEDSEDMQAFEDRNNEPLISYEQMIKNSLLHTGQGVNPMDSKNRSS